MALLLGLQSHDRLRETGSALLITLITLVLFSALSLYVSMTAVSEIRVSDNYESYVQARSAALAGLNHARTLLRGLRFDDLLEGPDGTHSTSASYIAYARSQSYRLPIDWSVARSIDILDPSNALAGLPDDGTISTGRNAAGAGQVLISQAGIALSAPSPYGAGALVTSRYFVKVSDNSGEASEMARDSANDPFHDGDGQIIVRSMGIAQTLREETHSGARKNSVVVFEAKFKRMSTLELPAAIVVQGTAVESYSSDMFGGTQFAIQGGTANYGIATIDADRGDSVMPSNQIMARLAADQGRNVQGAGQEPSVSDITAAIGADADKKLLLDKQYLSSLIGQTIPKFADSAYAGAQSWVGSAPAPLGIYDPSQPQNAPGQHPKLTYVNGDLSVDGTFEGAGLLVVTGKFHATGNFSFSGVIVVVGAGELDVGGACNVTGAVLVAHLQGADGNLSWGVAKLTVQGDFHIAFDGMVVKMANSLLPPAQLSFREITSIIDP